MTGPDKRRRRGALTPEDRALWETVKRTARPLRQPAREQSEPSPPAEPPAPEIRAGAVRARPVPAAAPGPKRPAPGTPPSVSTLDRRTVQRIARGATGIDGRIDLHGMTQAQAHIRLHHFLADARARGARVILVITGKGGQRPGDAPFGQDVGVLRRLVPLWLQEPGFRTMVAGYRSAHKSHGGEGALYIRLRRPNAGGRP